MNTLKTFSPRTVPGYVSVLGSAKTNATVSLWSTNSTSLYATTTRKGEYFHGELPLNNSTGAVWLTLTNLAVLQNGGNPDIVTNTIGQTFVAQTPEAFYYDLDGNLTNDGRWVYTWDAENRLVRMESSSAAPPPSKLKLEFAYDAKGRRIQKLVSTNNGSGYVAQYTNRFVYDGWNLVGVLSPKCHRQRISVRLSRGKYGTPACRSEGAYSDRIPLVGCRGQSQNQRWRHFGN